MTFFNKTLVTMARVSSDHILPRQWGGAKLHNLARNTRLCCQSCNQLRAVCGHCVGALAGVRAVSRDRGVLEMDVIREWGLQLVALDIRVSKAAGEHETV